jgi:hypothetical protein
MPQQPTYSAECGVVRCAFLGRAQMLKLRTTGLSDYSVLEGGQRSGRIRLATERMPCVWLWSISVHLTGGLPVGSSKDLDTATADFKTAWKALKARTPPEQLAAAYKAMNIRAIVTVRLGIREGAGDVRIGFKLGPPPWGPHVRFR